jgi:hypothetical protein
MDNESASVWGDLVISAATLHHREYVERATGVPPE